MGRTRSRLPRSATPRLAALLGGVVVGWVYEAANQRLAFRYEPAWQEASDAYPLSWSMPLAAQEHGDRATRAYLWGLLPDNDAVLTAWARRFGTSPLRAVDLLAHVGEDCPGAVQFARPERVDALAGTATLADEATSVAWLTDADIAARLRELRDRPGLGRVPGDAGQFSLPGAQPKTAYYESETGRWGVPVGRMPTTHILKPPVLDLEALAYNEHLCLAAARDLGLAAAASRVQRFGRGRAAEEAIVVERYDRRRADGTLVRIHQEDCCQALAVLPGRKYENQGGPSIVDIVTLLRAASSQPTVDVARFLDAVAFNWLIAGTDAHAKNYSILHAGGRQVRLAPLYDLISLLPYPERLAAGGHELAMAIGGEYRVTAIGASHWRTLAAQVRMSADALVARVAALADALPGALDQAVDAARPGAGQDTLGRLATPMRAHARSCLQRLGA